MNFFVFDSNRISFLLVKEAIIFQSTKQLRLKQFFVVVDNHLTIDDIENFDFDKLNSEIDKKYNFATIKIAERIEIEKKAKRFDN